MAPKLTEQIESTHEVIKAELDRRTYRGLVLKNGLKILLICDPITSKSAASINVQVGCLSDPNNIPGLAHLCEHMLLLGSKKYPKEDTYRSYLCENGGNWSAFTTLDHTIFFFDVLPEGLKKAVDIFSQFLLEPLFDAAFMSRELKTIELEHEQHLKDDVMIMWRLEGATCDQEHDFARCGMGSIATLETTPKSQGIDVHKALVEFHSQYYSANLISVCILGRESLDELSDIAVEMLSKVPNKTIPAPSWKAHPMSDKQLRLMTKVVSLNDKDHMKFMFPLPDMRSLHKANPGEYLVHLISHQGEGGLVAFLKAKDWIHMLHGVVDGGARGFAFFSIYIKLTKEGLKHTDDIAVALFQYLALLKKDPPQKWVYDEINNLGQIDFRLKAKENPLEYVSDLAGGVHYYELKDVLRGPYHTAEFKPEVATQLMNCLTPTQVRITISSKEFEGKTDKVEPFFGTRYSTEEIAKEKLEAWKNPGAEPLLRFPSPNQFVATDFTLCAEEKDYNDLPKLIINEPHTRVWYAQDIEFLRAIASVSFELRSPIGFQDALSACLVDLAVDCFHEANRNYFYPASQAGLSYKLDSTASGLLLEISGCNEKLPQFLDCILDRLIGFAIDPVKFKTVKKEYVDNLKLVAQDEPVQNALYYANEVLAEKLWTAEEALKVIDRCTAEACLEHFKKSLSEMCIAGLVCGNLNLPQAKKISECVRGKLKASPLNVDQTENLREYGLKEGGYSFYKRITEVHQANAVLFFYQVDVCDVSKLKQGVTNELFSRILDKIAPDALGAKMKFEVVESRVRRSLGTYGVMLSVQSQFSVSVMAETVDHFMNEYLKECLQNMPSKVVEKERNALALRKVKVHKTRHIPAKHRFWRIEMSERTFLFRRRNLEADEAVKISKEDLIAFYSTFIAKDSPKMRCLVVAIASKGNPGEAAKGGDPDKGIKVAYDISDLAKFKKDHGLLGRPDAVVCSKL